MQRMKRKVTAHAKLVFLLFRVRLCLGYVTMVLIVWL